MFILHKEHVYNKSFCETSYLVSHTIGDPVFNIYTLLINLGNKMSDLVCIYLVTYNFSLWELQ
jgi:hypothetical protein